MNFILPISGNILSHSNDAQIDTWYQASIELVSVIDGYLKSVIYFTRDHKMMISYSVISSKIF